MSAVSPIELRELAAHWHPSWQQAVLGLRRGAALVDNLEQLADIAAHLKEAAADEDSYRFWLLLEELILELYQGSLPVGRESQWLLGAVDGRLKALFESGRLFADERQAGVLSRRLIGLLAGSSDGLAWLESRADDQPPHPAGDLLTILPPSAETLHAIAARAKEWLDPVKEALDSLARDGTRRAALEGVLAPLRETANVLSMLNMPVPAGLLQRHQMLLRQWLAGTEPIAAEPIEQVAQELILVEGCLDGIDDWADSRETTAPQENTGRVALLREFQRRRAVLNGLRETIAALARARETAAGLAEGEGARADLQAVLRRAAGMLTMLQCASAAGLLNRLKNTVRALPPVGQSGDNSLARETFAETLTALEYYLELVCENREDEALLEQAGQRLDRLEALLSEPGIEPDQPAAAAVPAELRSVFSTPGPRTTDEGQMTKDVAAEPPPLADPLEDLERLLEPEFEPAAVPQRPSPWTPEPEPLPEPESEPVAAPELAAPRSLELEPLPEPELVAATTADPEILDIFFEEAREELANIRANLALWRRHPADSEALLAIRRSFHTLKGSGRMVQQFALGDFAWCFENLLNQVRDSRLAPSAAILEAVDAAQQALTPLVSGEAPGNDAVAALAALTARAEALLQEATAAEPAPAAVIPAPAAQPAAAPAEVDPELIEIFQLEAAELLDSGDTLLARWRREPAQSDELLNDLRRVMHTLKGSSRMAGFSAIGDLAHAVESVLGALATRHITDIAAPADAVQRTLDRLNTLLTGIGRGIAPAPAADLIDELDTLVGELPTAPRLLVPGEPAAEALTELDQELVDVFHYEAAELLDTSDMILQRWNAERDNGDLLNDLRRAMHTLKGSARMAGFMVIGDLAHAMESLLDAVAKGSVQPLGPVMEALQRALDGLNEMVAQVQSGTAIAPAEVLLDDLKALVGEAPVERKTRPAPAPRREHVPEPVEKAAAAAPEDTIRVSATLLNSLVNEMGESSIYRARVDQGVTGLRFNLAELDQTVFRLRQQLRRLEIETEAQILFRYEGTAVKEHQQEFDPLELDRFSELQQLSRSLMEIVEDLNNIKHALDDQTQEMGNLLDQQAKVNKEVQQGLMRTRMVRFATVAPRLRRVVRQAAQELDKEAELALEGAESEVDRTVLENMVAPLEHMLRNAISHGIEPPQSRRAAGKPQTGTITLGVRREGAELVLSLQDDGAGLNFEAIRAKGEAIGALEPGQPATEDELIALLLRPGFSTASKVTQIAGRGVGMDVLNDAVKTMRGALLIQTERGRGTNFIVRLPFSLAVTQALLVRLGDDTYAIPLLSIESVARLSEGQLKAYLGGQSVEYQYGDHRYPLHSLGVLFGVDSLKPYDELIDRRPPVLLFRSAEASAALEVDAVLGNQEIIVKPVGPQFQAMTGISGATVLGDGRVVVVLELAALVRKLTSQTQRQVEARALYVARQEVHPDRIRAMVIDDSITMRRVTGRFLERHQMEVTAAKDGVEAVAKLEEQIPDLVILDIEMPRMDGFEVAAHIRNRPHLRHIPIIMVTSRGGEKHRERAARLGVNAYLTKPYQEEEMLKCIRGLLGERVLTLQS